MSQLSFVMKHSFKRKENKWILVSAGFCSDLLLDTTALQLLCNKPPFSNAAFQFPLVNKSLFACFLVSFKVFVSERKESGCETQQAGV